MYKIKQTKNGYDIQLTRGDTFIATLALEKNGQTYTPTAQDSIRFALKHNKLKSDRTDYTDPEPLIEKTIPYDTMTLTIEPSDTNWLGFGEYAYDIEITSNGVVDTFIKGLFTLTEEVNSIYIPSGSSGSGE